jgi:hypothetical protein
MQVRNKMDEFAYCEYKQNCNVGIEHFMNSTANPWASDSLISLYQSDNRLSSSYLLVQYYLDQHNYTQTNNMLQNIPLSFDMNSRQTAFYDNWLALNDIIPALFTDTTGYLMPDSIQTTALEQLAEEGHYLPGAWARNILIASGLKVYQEPIVFTNQLKSSRKERYHFTRSGLSLSEFKVYPNPARDYIIVEYHKKNHTDEVSVDILDATGKNLQSFPFQNSKNRHIISLNTLLSGSYVIQFNINGTLKVAYAIIVIR